jgi:Ca-activated chloride channel family protein
MNDNAYKKVMDKLQPGADFEARTERLLERHLEKPAERKKPAPRRKFKAAGYAVAALAAALAVILIAPNLLPERFTMLRAREATPALETEATGIPAQKALEAGVSMERDSASLTSADAVAAAPMPGAAYSAVQPQFNTDEYTYIKESGFQSTLTNSLSTFAADVDTASYANVRRMLLAGEKPPADAVRIEEMLNYFHYNYPPPKEGEPFSVTTQISPCPWNPRAKLLLVGLQAKDIDESARPACNLVFLMDVSGSMEGADRLGLAQKAFLMLAEHLREQDRISIVTYAGDDRVVLEGAKGTDKAGIMTAIENLTAGGSTAGSEGIKTAYEIAQKYFIQGGNNRVILATDGDLNVGVTSEGDLTRLIDGEKQSGVFLSVMGFGSGNYKDNKLEALADNGNGNYSFIDSELEARKVLVEEMGASFFTVAKDVKLQIEFNPEKVAEYRQIGYEDRVMDSQDFSDDTKDGGEIGAGHRVTALYEIVEADGQQQNGLKYQQNQFTGSPEYLTVSVRAKDPDGDVSKLYQYPVGAESVKAAPSDDMAFAAAVTEVGMLLRGSEYSRSASYQSASDLLFSIPSLTADPYKDEFAYLVRKLARGDVK